MALMRYATTVASALDVPLEEAMEGVGSKRPWKASGRRGHGRRRVEEAMEGVGSKRPWKASG
ncbi:MAG: hypothetical protein ACYCV7_13105 [Acidimicrobiales bacterium]